MTNISKSPKIPPKSNKHTLSNCYSITIRPGNGVNLGSNTVISLINYINKHFTTAIFTLEKSDAACHFQGGIFTETPIRQDHLASKMRQFAVDMYTETTAFPTTKQLENVKKHSTKVVSHNSWGVLVSYCLKEVNPRIIIHNNVNFHAFMPDKYCPCNTLVDDCPSHSLDYDYLMDAPLMRRLMLSDLQPIVSGPKTLKWSNPETNKH